MSLERKDVRAYLDTDVHQALTAICNRRGITVADFIEALPIEMKTPPESRLRAASGIGRFGEERQRPMP